MTSLRRATAIPVVVALLVPAWGAHASMLRKKRKPVCNLVTDAAGDATGTGLAAVPAGAPNDPEMDILSADVATNATTLTAVLRLAALDTGQDNDAPTGREYALQFNVGDTAVAVNGVISPSGTTWSDSGTGIVDTKGKAIHISVPLSSLAVKIPPGTVLTNIRANTDRVGGSDQIDLGLVDSAAGSKSYTAGARSCVIPGK